MSGSYAASLAPVHSAIHAHFRSLPSSGKSTPEESRVLSRYQPARTRPRLDDSSRRIRHQGTIAPHPAASRGGILEESRRACRRRRPTAGTSRRNDIPWHRNQSVSAEAPEPGSAVTRKAPQQRAGRRIGSGCPNTACPRHRIFRPAMPLSPRARAPIPPARSFPARPCPPP